MVWVAIGASHVVTVAVGPVRIEVSDITGRTIFGFVLPLRFLSGAVAIGALHVSTASVGPVRSKLSDITGANPFGSSCLCVHSVEM